MKKYIYALIIISLAIIIIGLSTTGFFGLANQDVVKIGFIGPMTGDAASYGIDIERAINLALDKINLDYNKIELIVEDGKCNGQDAVAAINKLVNIDNVKIIIGPTCSSEVLGASPIAEANKILMISPAATNPDITNAGDYIFRVIPSDAYQGKVAANIATNLFNAKKVAILYVESDFPKGLVNEFSKNFNGEIVAKESIAQNSTEFKTQIQKIISSKPDLLYVIAYNTEYIAFFKQYLEIGASTPILGSDTLSDPTILSASYMSNYPVRIVYPFPKANWKNSELNKEFTLKYNKEINPYAPYAYDIVNLINYAIDKTGSTDSTILKNALYDIKYQGITGEISFDEFGDLANAEFEAFEIKNNEAKAIGVVN